jgi:hypothetical protein
MRPFRNLALNEFGAAVLRENRVEPRRAGDIEGNDMVTAAGQRLDDPSTDEAATAGYENAHNWDSADRFFRPIDVAIATVTS